MQTPVALIIFNRPQTTERVLAAIAKVKPSRLFVIADGPRPDRADDVEKCAAARKVIERVDWDCDVKTNFAEKNLGCGLRPSSGISWVFEHVDRTIILEDDCVPHPSFFRYCDELLERYADDERVMMISGNNFLPDGGGMKHSYTFFRSLNLWGWATWRRAWQRYDFHMDGWPAARNSTWFADLFDSPRVLRYWREVYDQFYVHADRNDVWDFQFAFAVMAARGLGIAPCCNLVSNIGFGDDATHTFGESDLANRPACEMPFPLRHPPRVEHDPDYDRKVFDTVFLTPNAPTPRLRVRLQSAIAGQVPVRWKRWWFRRSLRKVASAA